MSEQPYVEFSDSQTGGHPRDLLARLYREIGVSAVATALEIPHLQQEIDDRPAASSFPALGENIAA
jgi:hypothetical protein